MPCWDGGQSQTAEDEREGYAEWERVEDLRHILPAPPLVADLVANAATVCDRD